LHWQHIGLDIGKILLAAFLGAAIGFERESHGQAAGFRTNILVSVGACLMMMLSLEMEHSFRHLTSDTVVRLDPGRIASYAIASMGFLGGGAIIKGKGSVRGLTTAASLWLVTGLGLAVGAGFLLPALISTAVSLLILYNLRHLKDYFSRDIYTVLILTFADPGGHLEEAKEVLAEYPGIKIQFVNYHHYLQDRKVTYRFRLHSKEHMPWGKITNHLLQLQGLDELAWVEGDVP
jgi:putative Mg2+ transporter-C (MgtC) family protein